MSGEMSATEFDLYRQEKIESGLRYQDFVVRSCWDDIGLAIALYCSKKYQQDEGESRSGIEIKHDERYAETGNLWIETAEKKKPRPGPYAPAGILRKDNTWLYIIGNRNIVFIFAKKHLCRLFETGNYPTLENGTKTSLGFLLTHAEAVRFCVHRFCPSRKED